MLFEEDRPDADEAPEFEGEEEQEDEEGEEDEEAVEGPPAATVPPKARGSRKQIRIEHRLGCPRCRIPFTVWLQKTIEGASPRILLTCENCWLGFQVMTQVARPVQFDPFYQ